jgi:hypothetical protein
LTPYIIGKEDLLDQCRKTYKPLSSEKRLIVPGQVAREFAKNRAVDDVKSRIQEWRWNDPVTLLYSEVFDENTIADPPIDKDALQKDLEHRQLNKIPPGYKDGTKRDSGIGDLLIWYTILEVGKTKKKSVIFVSGDEKADWYLRGEGGQALYPRYELVDEFRRSSDGHTFHIIKFSHFLELFGASKQVVQEVRQEEVYKQLLGRGERSKTIHWENWIVEAVVKWIKEKYAIEPWPNPFLGSTRPDIELVEPEEGFHVGAEVNLVPNYGLTNDVARGMLRVSESWPSDFDKILLFLVYPDLTSAGIALRTLDRELEDVLMMRNTTFVIGHVEEREFLFLDIFPPERKEI